MFHAPFSALPDIHRAAIKNWFDGVPVYSPPRFGVKASMKRSVV